MKFLIFLFLLFSINCMAQGLVDSSLHLAKLLNYSGIASIYKKPFKSDTVKCVMLISDTSLHKWVVPFHWGFQIDSSSLNLLGLGVAGYDVPIMGHEDSAYDYSLRWKRGYCYNTDMNKIFWQYLDADKKPLSKNIIVWQSQ